MKKIAIVVAVILLSGCKYTYDSESIETAQRMCSLNGGLKNITVAEYGCGFIANCNNDMFAYINTCKSK